MDSMIVTTKEELKAAVESKCGEIIVRGDLAKHVVEAKLMKNLSPTVVAALIAGCALISPMLLAVLAGGFVAREKLLEIAEPLAEKTGLDIDAIFIISFVGYTNMRSLYTDWSMVERKGEVVFLR